MKILKSKKALSPVIAAIILIAVTVAVSIAVAAWMGALTFTFMATEQLQITNMEFQSSPKAIIITANNTGTTPVTISEVWINGEKQTTNVTYNPSSGIAAANSGLVITVTYDWDNGSNYQVKLVSSKGNQYYYSAVAPTS